MTPFGIDPSYPAWAVWLPIGIGLVLFVVAIGCYISGLRLRTERRSVRGTIAKRELLRWSNARYWAAVGAVVIGAGFMLSPIIVSALIA